MGNRELLKAVKETMDAYQAKMDADREERKAEMKAMEDKMEPEGLQSDCTAS
jgi:hypothetical protein